MSYVAVGKEHSGNIDLYEDRGTGKAPQECKPQAMYIKQKRW